MRGAITGKDVIVNSVTIVRLWGVGTYLHCLWAALTRRPGTFLGVLYPDGRRTRWTRARWSFRQARAEACVTPEASAERLTQPPVRTGRSSAE